MRVIKPSLGRRGKVSWKRGCLNYAQKDGWRVGRWARLCTSNNIPLFLNPSQDEREHEVYSRGKSSVSELEGDGLARAQAGEVRWDSRGERAFTFEGRHLPRQPEPSFVT